jgi:hypothetical protein
MDEYLAEHRNVSPFSLPSRAARRHERLAVCVSSSFFGLAAVRRQARANTPLAGPVGCFVGGEECRR